MLFRSPASGSNIVSFYGPNDEEVLRAAAFSTAAGETYYVGEDGHAFILDADGQPQYLDVDTGGAGAGDAQGRGPVLQNLFGKTITLQSGERVVVDEAYLRESILTPSLKVSAGFQPTMPTYQGLVSEEGLLDLIEYVKSLKGNTVTQAVRPASGGPAPNEATPAQAPPTRN